MESNQICNFLVKCRVYKEEMDKNNGNISFDLNLPGWLQMANMQGADFISKASHVAAEMLQETLDNPADQWEVEQYLQNLKNTDKGFDFRISRQSDGKPTGIVWVTSACVTTTKLEVSVSSWMQ